MDTQGAFLALCLLIATVPVVLLGIIIHITGFQDALRSVVVIGWAMLGFGVLLYWADAFHPAMKTAQHWSLKDAAFMGMAQALAVIPGTSRSGITITAARRLGYDRHGAAKLSMLMSIPTILASGVGLAADVVRQADWNTARDGLIAAGFSFASAYLALFLMMRLLRSVSFTPYVIYRVILGVVLLIYAYA